MLWLGRRLRRIVAVKPAALFPALLLLGAAFAVWAYVIGIDNVRVSNPCGCGAVDREVGFWHAINWSVTLIIFVPVCVTMLFAFSNAFQTTLLGLQEDGLILNRETSQPVAGGQIEHALDETFTYIGCISLAATAIVAVFGSVSMYKTSMEHVNAAPVYEQMYQREASAPDEAKPAGQEERAQCERLLSPNERKNILSHYRNQFPGEGGYPVDLACEARGSHEIDWSVAHLFIQPPGGLESAQWGRQVGIFTWAVTIYLLILCGALTLSGFLFAWQVVWWLWAAQLGQSNIKFGIPAQTGEGAPDYSVVRALRPVSVFLGVSTLAAMSIIYAYALWNDYLRSFNDKNFSAYLFRPFSAGVEAISSGEFSKVGIWFMTLFSGDGALAAGAFTSERMLALLLALIVVTPSALLAAFVRARHAAASPGQVSLAPGWRMLALILSLSVLSLIFLKLGVFFIGALTVLVARRAINEFSGPKPATLNP